MASSFLKKLGVILWKNLLLRKQQWLVTFFEVFFPIIGVWLLLEGIPSFSSERWAHQQSFDVNDKQEKSQTWIMKSSNVGWEEWCQSHISNPDKDKKPFIAYTPSNKETDEVIKELVSGDLCAVKGRKLPDRTLGYVSASTETSLETDYHDRWNTPNFKAAIIFDDGLAELKTPGSMKFRIAYTIRMPASCLPTTNNLFPARGDKGYRKIGPDKDNINLYKDCGFLGLQWHLDRILTRIVLNVPQSQVEPPVILKAMPYPRYLISPGGPNTDYALRFYGIYYLMAWSSCFLLSFITWNVVGEKQSGIAELLRLTGVPIGLQWVGWLIHVMIPQLIIILCVTLFLCEYPFSNDKPILRKTDMSLILIILLLHSTASCAIGFFISAVFKKPILATLQGVLTGLGSALWGMAYTLFDGYRWSPYVLRSGFAFFPNGALIAAFVNIVHLEFAALDDSDVAPGAQWSNLYEYDFSAVGGLQNISTGFCMNLMLLESVLITLLAIYLDGVLPSEHGIQRPWYFFNVSPRGQKQVTVFPSAATVASGSLPAPPLDFTDPEVPNEEDGPWKPPTVSNSQADTEEKTDKIEGEKDAASPDAKKIPEPDNFEPEPEVGRVGVELHNLYKKFDNNKMAMNKVNLKMFTGDIYVLLGENGAGKTTLISVLTGFFSPTAGTAYVNGVDIRFSLDKARESMGLCPQLNMLFDNLTVSEQLVIFGMLRGLTKAKALQEAEMLVMKMRLGDEMNTLAKNLSGDQKKKLALMIALIETKVVILDEPTSGMDFQARREIWDLLLQLRGERTILITTHFMEEADVLGDRIGIMAGGQLVCSGTASFLKKLYGTGYTLKVTLNGNDRESSTVNLKPSTTAAPSPSPSQQRNAEEAQLVEGTSTTASANSKIQPSSTTMNAILTVVQKHVPDATFKTESFMNRGENDLFFNLPFGTTNTAVLSQLFSALTSQKDKLEIRTMSLSQTTMDEVFVRAGEKPEQQNQPDETWEKAQKETERMTRLASQFVTVLRKKLHYSRQRWMFILFSAFLLLTLLILALDQTNKFVKPQGLHAEKTNTHTSARSRRLSHRKLSLTLSLYENPVTLYASDEKMANVIGPSAKLIKSTNMSGELLSIGKKERIRFKKKYVVSMERDDMANTVKVMFNLHPYHSAPLALNLANNYVLLRMRSKVTISATNHPFNGKPYNNLIQDEDRDDSSFEKRHGNSQGSAPSPNDKVDNEIPITARTNSYYNTKYSKKPKTTNNWSHVAYLVSGLLSLGLILFTAYFVVQPAEENMCKVKQLQTMTGISPALYWGATFTLDYGFFVAIVLLMFILLLIFDIPEGWGCKVLTPNGGWFVFIVICLAFGFAMIMYCYLVSLRANSMMGAYITVALVGLLWALLLGWVPDDDKIYYAPDALRFFLVLFRWLGRCIPTFSLLRGLWYWAEVGASNSQCPLLGQSEKSCPPPLKYWVWSVRVSVSTPTGLKEVSVPGVGQEVFFLILNGVIFLVWLMLVEYKLVRRVIMKALSFRQDANTFPPTANDEDVKDEMARVDSLLEKNQVDTEAMLVKRMCKKYGDTVAVNNLQFGVHFGECFGLLGVNGAGKTTALRIITGDVTPTRGDVYCFGTSLNADTNRFLSNIGYCPQFDAILNDFTGMEMLQLFAGLRGVKEREKEASLWLRRMGLSENADGQCGRYSAGMKRKLTIAMALIGDPDPALILLDEPTSTVDPMSRRQFWQILDKLRATGQSVILTSHSMEECEALCARLGIMVNGQLQCIGGMEQLKSKFAQGYNVIVKLKPDLYFGSPEVDEQISEFEKNMVETFQPCELKDQHRNIRKFHVKNSEITWDELFKSMENLKTEFESLIEEYSVNETSLEEVFLSFARTQSPDRRANVSLCNRIYTCSC